MRTPHAWLETDQVIGVQVGILEADRDKEVLIRVTTNWAPAK